MNVISSSFFSRELPALSVTALNEAQREATPQNGRTSSLLLGVVRWLEENTFNPGWMPGPLRNPFGAYLIAGLIQLVASLLMLLLTHLSPEFAFHGLLTLVALILVAVGWGTGPGIFASLTGIFLLWYVVLPPHFSWMLSDPTNGIGLVLSLVICIALSFLVGGSGRVRRRAEETAQRLVRAEAGSRFDAERLRAVLEVLPSAVLIANTQGELLAMNQASATLWGGHVLAGTDLIRYAQDNLYRAWHGGTGRPLAQEEWPLVRALASGQPVLNNELEIEALDGGRKVILLSAAPLQDETGAIAGAVVSAQDISDMRRLQLEVAESAQELEAVFEAMTDGIAVLDAQGTPVRTNRAFRTLHGVEPDSDYLTLPLQQRLSTLDPRDGQGKPLAAEDWPVRRLLRGEALATDVDIKIKSHNGREIVLNVGGAPTRDQRGRVSGCVEVFRDVTARQKLEQRSRETLDALVAMAEAMVQTRPTAPTGDESGGTTALPDPNTTLSLVAQRLAELTQSVLGCRRVSIAALDASTGQIYPVTQVSLPPELAQTWWASWSPAQRLDERYGPAIAARLRAGESSLLHTQQLPERSWPTLFDAQSGRIVPMRLGEELVGILVVAYAEPDHDFTSPDETLLTETLARLGALVLERDQLLRGWAETRASELALAETKAQMDTFLSIASHELKTPLTSLKLSLQLAERRLGRLRRDTSGAAREDAGLERAVEQLGRTAQQMERMESLVNDLLDVSRIQAGKLELHPGPADLLAIVREVIVEQREAAPQRSIRFLVPTDQIVPVEVDAGRIEQVVTNFLTNALKYSPADRPVAVGIEVVPADPGDPDGGGKQARVWVRDAGPGLPPEEQEQIWERFHRARGVEVQTGTGVGLGLGLYISRMIVERHHGQVGVESLPGQGATFWFTLPSSSSAAGDH